MHIHGLYGHPVSHSLSPAMFNATFQAEALPRVYVPFDVPTDRLADAVGAARTLGFDGFNVTMPHKTSIIDLLDRTEDESAGSVNTVVQRNGQLLGYSTDGEGALRAIKSYGLNPESLRVLLIGGGGAARALAATFSRETREMIILNRTTEAARRILQSVRGSAPVRIDQLSKESLLRNIGEADILVNATPLTTQAVLDNFGITGLPENLWLFDLAYADKNDHRSHQTISPLEMLLQQAALSYELWLDRPAPIETMRDALIKAAGHDWTRRDGW